VPLTLLPAYVTPPEGREAEQSTVPPSELSEEPAEPSELGVPEEPEEASPPEEEPEDGEADPDVPEDDPDPPPELSDWDPELELAPEVDLDP